MRHDEPRVVGYHLIAAEPRTHGLVALYTRPLLPLPRNRTLRSDICEIQYVTNCHVSNLWVSRNIFNTNVFHDAM